MTTTTRFLTGGLATLAVASAVTLAAPSAQAADLPAPACGQPAVPAVYTTVEREPVLRVVPAVTHDAWLWQRDVTTTSYEFSRVVREAYTETVDTTRVVDGVTQYLWSHRVVTQQAVAAVPGTPERSHVETVVVTPAVTVTELEYVQQTTGKLAWHEAGWNGEKDDEDKGKGWTQTGNSRVTTITPAVTEDHVVIDQPAVPGTPAVPEISHVEQTWASEPGGDGWTKVQEQHVVPAVVDTVWAATAPDGYVPTGASRVDTTTVQSDEASATAPDGDGWSQVPGSLVTVVDQPASTELVGGSTEQVLVTPAVPAGEPCPAAAPAASPVPGSAAAMSPTTQPGPAAAHATTHAAHAAHAPATEAASAGTTTTVLPEAGSPVTPLLLVTALGALAAGGVLVRAGRRRPTT